MTEGLAGADGYANDKHARLYALWGEGGTGLLLTGNIQIDIRSLERPGNVRIEGPQNAEQLNGLRAMARAGSSGGAQVWAQLSHAGRQAAASACPAPVAPSEMAAPEMPRWKQRPSKELSGDEIMEIIARFANSAAVCREAGFTGVQVHGAHGYLVSQFLSPLTNQRTDEWGGSLDGRARFLIETLRAIRGAVGPDFSVSLKMNSADFQRGGFTHDESMRVIEMLNSESLDLLEVTGGTYEQLTMLGVDEGQGPDRQRPSTAAREAYFVEYSADSRSIATMPIMATGGFRLRDSMASSLNNGTADVIGLARPLITDPAVSSKLINGEVEETDQYENVWQLSEKEMLGLEGKDLETSKVLGPQALFYMLLYDIGDGVTPDMTRPLATAQAQLTARDGETGEAIRALLAEG